MMKDSLLTDPTFEDFDAMEQAAQNMVDCINSTMASLLSQTAASGTLIAWIR